MRRTLIALSLAFTSLSLVAARCSSDDEDTKLKSDARGDDAAPPPDDGKSVEPNTIDAMPSVEKGDNTKSPDDELFKDPLDGAPAHGGGIDDLGSSPNVDDQTILDDSSTFDADPQAGAVSPDGPIEASPPEGTPPSLPDDPTHDGTSDLDGIDAPDLTQ